MIAKSLIVKSNTHYYEAGRTRSFNRVPNSYSFSFKSLKCQDYYVRSYFEYEDTKLHGGFTVFLTLTYNNNALPHFVVDGHSLPCFNNVHITKLIHALRQRLVRLYKLDFSYLITKEYGSRKSRPHYHALFFVKNTLKSGLNSRIFVDHVKELWQGNLSEHHNNYKLMKYGLVHAGENFGEVFSHSALEYTCKYAVKDLTAQKFEFNVFKLLSRSIFDKLSFDSKISLVEDWLNVIPDGSLSANWVNMIHGLNLCLKPPSFYSVDELSQIFNACLKYIKFQRWYLSKQDNEFIKLFNEFKNHYSCKPQHSNQLGLSAVDSKSLNKLNGTLLIYSGRKVKSVPVPLYIYRKLFYDPPYIDENTGNVKYTLSEAGIAYKLNTFGVYKENLYKNYLISLEYCKLHSEDFREQFNIDLSECILSKDKFCRLINYLVVYAGRSYDPLVNESLDVLKDYKYSLDDAFYRVPFNGVVYSFNSSRLEKKFGLISYKYHPYFENIDVDNEYYNFVVNYHFTYYDADKELKHELYKRIKESHNFIN